MIVSLPQIGLHGAAAKSSLSPTASHGKFADILAESQSAGETNTVPEGLSDVKDAPMFGSTRSESLAGKRGERGNGAPSSRRSADITGQKSTDDAAAKLIATQNTLAVPLVAAGVVQPKPTSTAFHIETADAKSATGTGAKSELKPVAHFSPGHSTPSFQSDALFKASAVGLAAHAATTLVPVPGPQKHTKGVAPEAGDDGKALEHAAKAVAHQDAKTDEVASRQASASASIGKVFESATNSADATLLARSPLHHAGLTVEDANRTTSKGSQPRTTVSVTPRSSVADRPVVDGREINLAAHNPGPVLERFAEGLTARGPQVQAEGRRRSSESVTTRAPEHGKTTPQANVTSNHQSSEQITGQNGVTAASSAPTISAHAVQPVPVAHGNVSDSAREVSRPLPPSHEQSMAQAAANRDAAGEVSAPVIGSAVHTARLVERMGQSEVRVGIHAGEFGNVAIRTSLGRNQFTAEISVERGELGRVLAAELPNLHTRLSEHHLPEANLILQHPSSGGSGDARQNSPHNQGMRTSGAGDRIERNEIQVPMFAGEASESSSRLDIHL